MNSKLITISVIASAMLQAATIDLDTIVVDADFHQQNLSAVDASATHMDAAATQSAATSNPLAAIAKAANINYAAGASQAKYLQIRGIGERSQFDAPLNPSIGLVVDGIDLSNTPLGFSLDMADSADIYRGPQGMLFGVNAIGGVVSAKSTKPKGPMSGDVAFGAANYNSYSLKANLQGTISSKLSAKLRFAQYQSDGYMKNSHLHKEDTNNVDRIHFGANLYYDIDDVQQLRLTYQHARVKNGYDAFTLDNSRTSQADTPGSDNLELHAVALGYDALFRGVKWSSTLSALKARELYSYDEDWVYKGKFDKSLWPYNSFDSYKRVKNQYSFDTRLVSNEPVTIAGMAVDWSLGLYAKRYDEELKRYRPNDWDAEVHFGSDYTITTTALYSQIDLHLDSANKITFGARGEQAKQEYSDTHGASKEQTQLLWGGKLSYHHQLNSANELYVTLSKGYKPGGFNAASVLPEQYRSFAKENLYNIDLGGRFEALDGALKQSLNLFAGKRDHQQAKYYYEKGHDFAEYVDNGAKGYYSGLEYSADYVATDALSFYGNFGLLHTRFKKSDLESSRSVAHAPRYNYRVGASLALGESWLLDTSIYHSDSFYFSNTHDQKSSAYSLVDASLSYFGKNYKITFWGKNLFDKEYATRGFYFANNPKNGWAPELYTQKGAPRTFGATFKYSF